MKRAILILSAAFFAGCAGTNTAGPGPSAAPVSEQVPAGMAERSAKTHTELGTLYLQAGNFVVALEEARLAAAIDPGYAPAFDLMGLVHLALNEMPQAGTAFERASQLAPGDPQIANDYGWFLCLSGREQEVWALRGEGEGNRRIAEISSVISDIAAKTKVINDIVFQTKLLSFNASVEAARAGENGKGFAVVAEEVGNLAQMSGRSAGEISAIVEESIRKVDAIVTENKSNVEKFIQSAKLKVQKSQAVASKCGTMFDQVVDNTTKVNGLIEEISRASSEQSKGIEEITNAMGQIDLATNENSTVTHSVAKAAKDLSGRADVLKEMSSELYQTVHGKKAA